MRIFYAAADSPNILRLPSSKVWRNNLYAPLVDLGHELVEFEFDYQPANLHLELLSDADRDFWRTERPRASQELLDQVKRAHASKPLDLFFSYFFAAYVEPAAIRAIADLGITTVNWYCNASYQLHLVADIAPAYHYCLVPEKFRLDDYRRLGANPIYCQEAANPNVYKPHDVPIEFDVTFVGQKYGDRPALLSRLHRAGVDVRAFGPGWRPGSVAGWVRRGLNAVLSEQELPLVQCGPPLSDDELVRMYSKSRISLGFGTVADTQSGIKQVRLRDFEVPMSGGFYLVEAFDELTEFFEPDREVVFFRDAGELTDKSRYYLTHQEDRERIRQAGLRRARIEHTWQRRFEQVFRQIGVA
jgi:spore maturation protein CgeB